MYSALIASLLVVIYTRRKPNKMLLWTLQLYFQGIASTADVEAKVNKCKPLAN